MRFNIGDIIWHASCRGTDKWITCPDCFGTKTLKVILGDGTELVIPCAGCACGFDPPRGVVKTYDYGPRVEQVEITGVEMSATETKYRSSGWIFKDDDVFATKEEAEARCVELVAQRVQEEADRLHLKEKDHRSWAWHVHYHRDEIRRKQKEIEMHTAKLNVALEHSKEQSA